MALARVLESVLTRIATGPARPRHPRWIALPWLAVSGYVAGFTSLSFLFATPPDDVGVTALAVMSAAPAVLSALVGGIATLPRSWGLAGALGFALSVGAAVVCSPCCYLLLKLSGARLGYGDEDVLALTVVVAIFGAIFAIPLGLVFGSVYAAFVSALAALSRRGARAGIDAMVVVAGLGWVGVGLACAFADAIDALPRGGAAVERQLLSIGLVLAGCALAAIGVARWEMRRWFLARVRAGEVPRWALADPASIPDAGALAPLFPFGRTDAVLVRREPTAEGPFRSTETARPLARVPA